MSRLLLAQSDAASSILAGMTSIDAPRAGALSRQQLDKLDNDGYVVLKDAIDQAHVARLLRAFEGAPQQADGTQHVILGEGSPDLDSWQAIERHPAILAAAEHVLKRPFRIDLHGRNPLPGFGQQGLHADARPRQPKEPFSVLTALWMLDDFTIENGATRVVPGSHHLTRPLEKSLAQPSARHPDEIVVTGSSGSVLILNGHLLHSGRRNAGAGSRRAVQMVLRTA